MKHLKTFEKFSEKEIDKILDKILDKGKDSLTREEEFILTGKNSERGDYKDTIIDEIKSKVENSDDFPITMEEMGAESSPLYKEIDQEIHLVEALYPDYVKIVVYDGYKYENEKEEYDVDYEDLTVEILEDILDIINK